MKKIFCVFVGFIVLSICGSVQATQSSKPAAPYTAQAYNKLFKVAKANQKALPAIRKNTTSSEALDLYLKYYSKLWGIAGYDFKKSMNKYVYDMNVNSVAIMTPPVYQYAAPEMLAYLKISELCKNRNDELILKKYFSQSTVNSFSVDIAKKLVQAEKPKYWFPQDVVPCMLTDMQTKAYEVVTENALKCNFNINSPFLQQKIKEAKMQNRPLINKDIAEADKDCETLKKIGYSLNDGLSQETCGECYGSLNEKQEANLNRIINEYGTSVLDDNLKSKLKKYRQRQAYLGRKDINSNNKQSQSTDADKTNSPDRADVMRFYNGANYYTPNSSTVKNVVVPSAFNKFVNYAFGLINY